MQTLASECWPTNGYLKELICKFPLSNKTFGWVFSILLLTKEAQNQIGITLRFGNYTFQVSLPTEIRLSTSTSSCKYFLGL